MSDIIREIEAEQLKEKVFGWRHGKSLRKDQGRQPGEDSDIRGHRPEETGRQQPGDIYCQEDLQWRRRGEDMAPAFAQC